MYALAEKVPQFPGEVLQTLDGLREDCAEVVRDAFPGPDKRLPKAAGLPSTFLLSRARNGDVSNPVYRVDALLVSLRVQRAPRERAERMVEHFSSLVDALWSDDRTEVRTLSLCEQAPDGNEDFWQAAFCEEDPRTARQWLDALEERDAASRPLKAALRRIVSGINPHMEA